MININLLPVELRPRRKTTLPIKGMSLIGGGIVIILIVCYLLIGIKIKQENNRLSRLEKEFKTIQPEYERVKKLKADKERLEARVALMEKLLLQRRLWAKKLNELSDLMSPHVWLSSLSVVTREVVQKVEGKEVGIVKETLVLCGKTYSGKGEKMVEQQGDFMRRIKGHEAFFKDFDNVEFISTERETIGSTDIMKFELTCQFK